MDWKIVNLDNIAELTGTNLVLDPEKETMFKNKKTGKDEPWVHGFANRVMFSAPKSTYDRLDNGERPSLFISEPKARTSKAGNAYTAYTVAATDQREFS